MKIAQCVYATVDENEGEFYFDGQTPAELQRYIKKTKWLEWNRRLSDKGTGKEKWFLIADFTDKEDVDEYGINRSQRLANVFLENGMILYYRSDRTNDFDLDYEKYVWR
ncbi:MAG: hypothetical protein IJV81_09595 [Paludibacteraceae bacterium]|nr:hypothetical protein [Paludibacteraceae bacterium]